MDSEASPATSKIVSVFSNKQQEPGLSHLKCSTYITSQLSVQALSSNQHLSQQHIQVGYLNQSPATAAQTVTIPVQWMN